MVAARVTGFAHVHGRAWRLSLVKAMDGWLVSGTKGLHWRTMKKWWNWMRGAKRRTIRQTNGRPYGNIWSVENKWADERADGLTPAAGNGVRTRVCAFIRGPATGRRIHFPMCHLSLKTISFIRAPRGLSNYTWVIFEAVIRFQLFLKEILLRVIKHSKFFDYPSWWNTRVAK